MLVSLFHSFVPLKRALEWLKLTSHKSKVKSGVVLPFRGSLVAVSLVHHQASVPPK
jgi:hypothetical protein